MAAKPWVTIAERISEGLRSGTLRRFSPALLEDVTTGRLVHDTRVPLNVQERELFLESMGLAPQSRGAVVPLAKRPVLRPELRPVGPPAPRTPEQIGFAGPREPSAKGLFPIRRPRTMQDPQDVGAVRPGSRRAPQGAPTRRLVPFDEPVPSRPQLRRRWRDVAGTLDDLDPKEKKRILNNSRELERRLEGAEGYLYANFLANAENAEQFERMWRVTQRAATEGRRVGSGSISGYSGRGGVQVGSNFDADEIAAINEAALETALRLNLPKAKGITAEKMLAKPEDGGLGFTEDEVIALGFEIPTNIVDTGVKKVARKQGKRPVTGVAERLTRNQTSPMRGLKAGIEKAQKNSDVAALDEIEDYLIRGREEALIEEALDKVTAETSQMLGETMQAGVRRFNEATAGGMSSNQYDILLNRLKDARAKISGASIKSSQTADTAAAAIKSGSYTPGKHAYAKDSIKAAQTRADLLKISSSAQEALNSTKGLPEADVVRFRMELNDAALAKMDEFQGIEDVVEPTRVAGVDFGLTDVEYQNRALTESADFRGVVEDPMSMRRTTDRGGEFERESTDFVGGLPMDTGRKPRPRRQSTKPRPKSGVTAMVEEARQRELAKPIDQILSEGPSGLSQFESVVSPKAPGLSPAEARAMSQDVSPVLGGQARITPPQSTPLQRAWTAQNGRRALESVRNIRTREQADAVYRAMVEQRTQIEPWLYRRLAMEWREALRRTM